MKPIHRLQRKWSFYKLIEAGLLGLAVGLAVLAVGFVLESNWAVFSSLLATCFSGIAWLLYKGFFKDQSVQLASHLDQKYPELENSSHLLLQSSGELNLLEQLQQEKVKGKVQSIFTKVKIPHQIPRFLGAFLLGFACCYLVFFTDLFDTDPNSLTSFSKTEINPEKKDEVAKSTASVTLELLLQQIEITPPAYTGIQPNAQKELDLKVPIDALVRWEFRFNIPMKTVVLHFNAKKPTSLSKQGEKAFVLTQKMEESGFYFLEYESQDGQKGQSDYAKIELIPDLVPELKVAGLQAYETLPYDTMATVAFKVAVQDDYGIKKAQIVATVAKGDGESVQFKNDTLEFRDKGYVGRRSYEMSEQLNLHRLGVGPGDELYLHFEATDNRLPKGQIGKTFKYILVFEDTTKVERAAFGKLAVDRMPEYFRSQRQIIIDTEKLLAARSQYSPERFREIANNIGIDQKALRLRYGKFLGEESESIIGEGDAVGDHDHAHHLPPGHEHETAEEHAAHAHEHHEHEGHKHEVSEHNHLPPGHEHETTEEHAAHAHEHHEHEGHEHAHHEHEASEHSHLPPGHEHETAEEHAAHAHEHEGHEHNHPEETIGIETHEVQHAHEHHHDHGGAPQEEGAAPDVQALIEPYAHMHDVVDMANYFDESTIAKLRVALTEMWNSELHLRTGYPEKALPYQHKALKLIKQIQQASRVYVERVGFEPPAIKEREMRYKGELEDIEDLTEEKQQLLKQNTKSIQAALPLLDRLWQTDKLPNIPEQNLLQEAGNELAALALEEAGVPIGALGKLRLLITGKVPKAKRRPFIRQVQQAFWKLVPPKRNPVQFARGQSRLKDLYLKKIAESSR